MLVSIPAGLVALPVVLSLIETSGDSGTLTGTLTQDLMEPIQIVSAGITLDGAGHTITGTVSDNDFGVYLIYDRRDHQEFESREVLSRNQAYRWHSQHRDRQYRL